VGSACKISSSDGCTVMVTMDMTTSQLTPPLIIYKGTFGGTLMKKWQSFSKALVVFTEKHWMTSEVFILYLQYLRRLCPGHDKIGLIIDRASMHTSKDVIHWIQETNLTETPVTITVHPSLEEILHAEPTRFIPVGAITLSDTS
jgi:DDE superfamily endonuclease